MVELTVQEKILDILTKSSQDLPIQEIATHLSVERHTAAKHLESLKAKGLCEYRSVGRSKLWSVTDSPLLSVFTECNSPLSKELMNLLKQTDARVTIQDKDMNVIWSTEKKTLNKKCYKTLAKKNKMCPDCPVIETFENGKELDAKGHGGNVHTTPLKKNGETVAVINIMKHTNKQLN